MHNLLDNVDENGDLASEPHIGSEERGEREDSVAL